MFAGCGQNTTKQPEDSNNGTTNTPSELKSIKVGIMAPLTGDVSVYGIAAKNGAQLAFEEINAAGGINGVKIDLEILDEKGDPAEAVNAYNKLMSYGIDVLLGDVTSKPTIAVAELAADDRIPMITPTATAPAVTTYGDNIFRACFIDPFQGDVMATFAADNLKVKTAAVVYNTSDDYSSGAAESFKKTAEEKGIQIVAYEGYGNDDKDFKTQLTKIQSLNADVLFIPDYYERVALIATQARSVGYNNTLLGTDGWDGVLGVIDAANASVLDNTYFSNHYSVKDNDNKIQNFIKNYQEKYGETPNSFAALGYDAAYIIAEAIKRAGTTDKEAVIKALKETEMDAVTGHITFDENNNPIKSVAVTKILNNDYVLETKVTP